MERKYRGQAINTKEWVYGNLIGADWITGDVVDWDTEYICLEKWQMVIPETVGQYTGLKDKNGKEIYEDDIIRFGNQIGLIGEMQNGSYTFCRKEKYIKCDPLPFCSMSFKYVEVLSNIYDNPELLQEVEK
jgi:uncharacterized phage protein (TIGR01671 family)